MKVVLMDGAGNDLLLGDRCQSYDATPSTALAVFASQPLAAACASAKVRGTPASSRS